MSESGKGPSFYENWKAALVGKAVQSSFEFPFFTDAHITGTIEEGYGPYQFINTVLSSIRDTSPRRPAIIFRVDLHLTFDPSELEMDKTDDERYHGGDIQDEAAALVSLSVGIRLKSGAMIRRWYEPHGDPKGYPCYFQFAGDPVLPTSVVDAVVPRALGNHSLDDITPIANLHRLPPKDAVVLIRAARLYQDGLWISESEPNLSWLMFISALETAANHWRTATETPVDRLRTSRPNLEEILKQYGGDELVLKVAEEVAPYMGSTKKFVDFVLAFLPDPPSDRPYEWAQHSWNTKHMKASLGTIYKYRSRALHGGKPFPAPMCHPPDRLGPEVGVGEIPAGLATSDKGGIWLNEDTPMLLHTFEYIVRGALLNWCQSLTLDRHCATRHQ
jgi:hypothetical protein